MLLNQLSVIKSLAFCPLFNYQSIKQFTLLNGVDAFIISASKGVAIA